jgi:hypothetical protein
MIGVAAANIVGFHAQFDGTETRHATYRCHEKATIKRVPSGWVLCHTGEVPAARGKSYLFQGDKSADNGDNLRRFFLLEIVLG